ncbi:hypothetical protein AAG906_004472 [Vitis piasezkii]
MAGQSDPHISLFSAQEVEFLGEDEMVEIVPNMRMDPEFDMCMSLFCHPISIRMPEWEIGDFGPFRPQIATQVPLWLAVALKKRGKCTIRPPEWMSVGEYS